MSDTTLNRYLTYGTNAERLAFTPSPPVGVHLLYEWRETDTGNTYLYDTAWHLLGGGGGSGITELTGDVVAGPGSGSVVSILSATTATPGTYGSGTTVPVITVDVKGRITASSSTPIVASGNVAGAASSVDGEGVLFSGTTGKVIQRATGTGVVHRTSGVDSVGAVVLSSEVSGDLPFSSFVQASAASKLVGRGGASGAGDFEEITLGTNLAMSGTTLNASAAAGTVSTTGSPASGNLTKFSGAATVTNGDLTGEVTTSGTLATTISTSATPQVARLGLGAAADSGAVLKAVGQYYSPLVADGNSGTTKTLDFNAGNEHYLTLTGNVTLTLSNPKDGGRYVVLFNTGAGSFTVTWPVAGSAGGVYWPSGTAPTITTTAGRLDIVTLMYVTVLDRYIGAFNQDCH